MEIYGDLRPIDILQKTIFNADGSYKEGIASQKKLEQDGFVYVRGY